MTLLPLPQLMYYLKNVRFDVLHTGEQIYFDDGDVEGFYDIINWQFDGDGQISYVAVGRYNGSQEPEERLVVFNDSILWNNEELQVIAKKKKKNRIKSLQVCSCFFPSDSPSGNLCCSLPAQCAARTASREPGRGSGRESRSAASTASPAPTERSATPRVSRGTV